MYVIDLDSEKRYLRLHYSNHITENETKEIIMKVLERVVELTGSIKILYQLTNLTVERFCHEYIDTAIYTSQVGLKQQVAFVVHDEISRPVAKLLQEAYEKYDIESIIVDNDQEAKEYLQVL